MSIAPALKRISAAHQLHEILRSDDDRAGHDHPWSNTSYIIDGGYDEVVYYRDQPWQEAHVLSRKPGEWVSRDARNTHRLIVPAGGRCVSLFLTGPKVRESLDRACSIRLFIWGSSSQASMTRLADHLPPTARTISRPVTLRQAT